MMSTKPTIEEQPSNVTTERKEEERIDPETAEVWKKSILKYHYMNVYC